MVYFVKKVIFAKIISKTKLYHDKNLPNNACLNHYLCKGNTGSILYLIENLYMGFHNYNPVRGEHLLWIELAFESLVLYHIVIHTLLAIFDI